MAAQHQLTRRLLLDRRLQPSLSIVHVAEAGGDNCDPPGRNDPLGSRLDQLSEHPTSLGVISLRRLEMGESEGRSSHPARNMTPLLVLLTRFVEPAERLEGTRKPGMSAIESRVELERHSVVEHRLLVLAGEVIGVS